MKLRLSLPLLLLLSLLPSRAQDPTPPQGIESAQLGGAVNVHRSGDLWFSGRFTPEEVAVLEERGIRRVIRTQPASEVSWDEQGLLEQAGLEFVSVPFRQPETLTDEVFDRIRELLGADSGPVLLHCASANRVGGAWLPYRVLDQGVPLERALAEAKTIGLRTAAYKELAVDYIERRRASGVGRRKSVKEGINDTFKASDLDVQEFVERFEVESREVFSARHEVLEVTGLKPGMRVADVGAGTGLYTFLFSEAVGAEGWVYAIDVAPRFIDRIRGLASNRNVRNVTGVLCAADSIDLPPASIDLAFVCDTYHHFEFPLSSTRSIHRALKPGGRLIVVDFERIPDVSREWILGHMRAGKDEFRAEIERAGFELVREVEVDGLEENYLLEFGKVGD